jgi:sensor histidine kinase YesM
LQVKINNISNHFIFNTLNSINLFIVENKTKLAVDCISKFGKLLRLSTAHSMQDKVTLVQELEIVELYVMFEKIRYNDAFVFEVSIDSSIDAANTLLAPLSLVPYLEKAIWRSVSDSPAFSNITLEVTLHKSNQLQYAITSTLSHAPDKLFHTPSIVPRHGDGESSSIIHLYDDKRNAVAQREIISVTTL